MSGAAVKHNREGMKWYGPGGRRPLVSGDSSKGGDDDEEDVKWWRRRRRRWWSSVENGVIPSELPKLDNLTLVTIHGQLSLKEGPELSKCVCE